MIAGLFFFGGSNYICKKPTVSVKMLTVKDVSKQSTELTLYLEVDNPNVIGLSLDKVTYQLDLNNVSNVVSGETIREVKINASGLSNVEVPLTVHNQQLLPAFNFFLMSPEKTYYSIDGELVFFSLSQELKVPFIKKGEFDNKKFLDILKKEFENLKKLFLG